MREKEKKEVDKQASLDPPAELPDLAMESLPSDEEDEDMPKNSVSDEVIEEHKPKETLPDLDIKEDQGEEIKEEKQSSYVAPAQDFSGESNDKTEEANQGITEKETPVEELHETEKDNEGPHKDELKNERVLKQGFFSRLFHGNHEDISVSSMKAHHKTREEYEKAKLNKSRIHESINYKVRELEMLEEGWYLLKKEIETKEILLEERETLIDQKLKDLQEMMDRLKKIPPIIPPLEHHFMLQNGKTISSVEELKELLKVMDDAMYSHHVNGEKNDFSSWIREVFEDGELADKILKCQTKEELIKVLEDI